MLEAGGDEGAGWGMVPSDDDATASTTEGTSTIITVGGDYEMDNKDDDDDDDWLPHPNNSQDRPLTLRLWIHCQRHR